MLRFHSLHLASLPAAFGKLRSRITTHLLHAVLTAALVWVVPAPAVATPLNGATSVVAAFSLRKLREAYTGPLVRIRRSSDNSELDVYADTSGNLDTAAITAFTGSGTAFVTTWYDQSGQGNNATQTTTSAQPFLMSAGTMVTVNGRPAIQANAGGTQFLYVMNGSILGNNLTTTTENYINAVAMFEASTGHAIISNDSPGKFGHGIGASTNGSTSGSLYAMYNAGFLNAGSGTFPFNQLSIVEIQYSTTLGIKGWRNGTLIWNLARNDTGKGGTDSGQAVIFICQPNGGGCSNSGRRYISEIIVTKGAAMTTTARAALVRSQGSFFGITTSVSAASVVLNLTQQIVTLSDPLNGTTNPKGIPGSVRSVKLTVQNTKDAPDSNSLSFTFPINANLDLFVGNLSGGNPYIFTDGSPTCGISPNAISYFDASGNPMTPVGDANGYASGVRQIKMTFTGQLYTNWGTPPTCSVTIQARVR